MKLLLAFSLSLMLVFAVSSELSALDQNKGAYAGGTVGTFNDSHGRVEGHLDLSDLHALVFVDTKWGGRTPSRLRTARP